jgi:hypothetical protein
MAELTAHDFELKVESGGGDTANYRIVGQVRCPSPGYSFDVRPYPEGIVPSDENSAFELLTNEPTGVVIDPITDIPVDHEFRDSNRLQTARLFLRGDVRTEDGNQELELHVPM